jgi:hypothetical protein
MTDMAMVLVGEMRIHLMYKQLKMLQEMPKCVLKKLRLER